MAKKPPKKIFTVDPPDGIRMHVGETLSTDVVSKNTDLEFAGVKNGSAQGYSKSIPFVHLKRTSDGQLFRLPYAQAQQMVEQGVLRE